jgi:Arabinose-binding domain of AraC transcription regulator, N-term
MHRIRVPSMAASRLESLGVSPLALLQQAHLPLTLLHQERPVLSTSQWFALWHALEDISSDAALGLKIGSDIPVERYDPFNIVSDDRRPIGTQHFIEVPDNLHHGLVCSSCQGRQGLFFRSDWKVSERSFQDLGSLSLCR